MGFIQKVQRATEAVAVGSGDQMFKVDLLAQATVKSTIKVRAANKQEAEDIAFNHSIKWHDINVKPGTIKVSASPA